MLVLSTLRHRIFVQKTLRQFIKKNNKKQLRFADFAIETAATEILFMDTPDYAILNSYINLIKQQSDKYIANFANAVNLTTQKPAFVQRSARRKVQLFAFAVVQGVFQSAIPSANNQSVLVIFPRGLLC